MRCPSIELLPQVVASEGRSFGCPSRLGNLADDFGCDPAVACCVGPRPARLAHVEKYPVLINVEVGSSSSTFGLPKTLVRVEAVNLLGVVEELRRTAEGQVVELDGRSSPSAT